MADVGSALNNTATGSSDDRGNAFRANDGARVVFITGCRSTFGTIDPANHSAQRKGNHNRQILDRIGPRLQPFKPQCSQPLSRPERGLRINSRLKGTGRNPASRCADGLNQTTDQEGGQSPWDAQWKWNSCRETGEHDPQRQKPHEWRTKYFKDR